MLFTSGAADLHVRRIHPDFKHFPYSRTTAGRVFVNFTNTVHCSFQFVNNRNFCCGGSYELFEAQ